MTNRKKFHLKYAFRLAELLTLEQRPERKHQLKQLWLNHVQHYLGA